MNEHIKAALREMTLANNELSNITALEKRHEALERLYNAALEEAAKYHQRHIDKLKEGGMERENYFDIRAHETHMVFIRALKIGEPS